MSVARAGQTATLLPNGKVLIAGGGTAAADLYDPSTGMVTLIAHMSVARNQATATLLPNGKVLVAGGCCQTPYRGLNTAELYDPATGTWTLTGSMASPRSADTATLLPNGKVLVAGGACNGQNYGCDAGSFLVNQSSAELYDPATGTWSKTGSMHNGRDLQTATLLANGKVLVVGGFNSCDDDFCTDLKESELYDPTTATWTQTGSMQAAREQHSATRLANGDVLVAGGFNAGGFNSISFRLASAELYNSRSGTWTQIAPMPEQHTGHTATLLSNGWVLVAGGQTAAADVYEPSLSIWVPVGSFSTVRTDATATLLPNHQVLVTGGSGPDGSPQASDEVYTAGRGPLVVVTPSSVAFGGVHVGVRSITQTYSVTNYGSANLRVSGVEVTGTDPGDFRATTNCAAASLVPGWSCTVSIAFSPTYTGLRTAEVAVADDAPLNPQGAEVNGYGIGPDTWAPTGSMSTPRSGATVTLLRRGTVLIAGGGSYPTYSLSSAEVYSPATGAFSLTGSMNTPRTLATAVRLPDGDVLVAGGYNTASGPLASAELYDPQVKQWTVTGTMQQAGDGLSSVLLLSGKVLVTGFGPSTGNTSYSELYDPTTQTWSETPAMPSNNYFGDAVILRDGTVLTFGGETTAAEIYDPTSNTWTPTGSLLTIRQSPTATLLPDGKVLVAGGRTPNGGPSLSSAEVYNPTLRTWSSTGSMSTARWGQSATLLPNGSVLVAGGCSDLCSPGGLATAEIYTGGYWSLTGSMTIQRVRQIANLLPDGTVLVVGGLTGEYGTALASAEIYTPVLAAVSPTSGPAGEKVTVTGSGFYAHEGVTLYWNGSVVLGRADTSNTGTFTALVTIPTTAGAGPQTITASGSRSFAGATTTFLVTG